MVEACKKLRSAEKGENANVYTINVFKYFLSGTRVGAVLLKVNYHNRSIFIKIINSPGIRRNPYHRNAPQKSGFQIFFFLPTEYRGKKKLVKFTKEKSQVRSYKAICQVILSSIVDEVKLAFLQHLLKEEGLPSCRVRKLFAFRGDLLNRVLRLLALTSI